MSIQHNAHEVAARLHAAQADIRQQLAAELGEQGLAARVARAMRRRAPKFRSTLTNSIRADQEAEYSWLVAPHVAYAGNVEEGRTPGKGLPRFFDPASRSIVDWLESRITSAARASNPKFRPGKVGSSRRTAAELELRNRYMALSRHVKAHGLKAHPYIKPTADEYRRIVPDALVEAVKRGVRLARFGQGGTAT